MTFKIKALLSVLLLLAFSCLVIQNSQHSTQADLVQQELADPPLPFGGP